MNKKPQWSYQHACSIPVLNSSKNWLLLLFFFCTTLASYSQVTVTGALVGNGTYTTLGAAF
ncbi:MAG: hypothetical protein ACK45I_05260, partial [Bacteroidota bacterium]